MFKLIGALCCFCIGVVAVDKATIVVTGATGRTGLLLYKRLIDSGEWNVRAFVRNRTKARQLLNCSSCDDTDGIFVGDLTDPPSLVPVMRDSQVLAIATSSVPQCTGSWPDVKCHFPQGATPKDIDWKGTKMQTEAFASAHGENSKKQILYVSTMDTTIPDNFLDKMGNGWTSFYHLLGENFIMSSGIPYTIVKACGLTMGPASQTKLIIGHNDKLVGDGRSIARDDVARVCVEAVRDSTIAANLRFDLCSLQGSPTKDIVTDVFKAATWPWKRSNEAEIML